MTLRAIDLFCGIGGNSWGAQQAGVEIVAGFDQWDLAGKVYQDNFPQARFYGKDLTSFSRAELKHIQEEVGRIDLILASPECTSHSVARGNKPKREESLRLSWHVLRFAKLLQPRWIVIENVTAMRVWSRYKDFLRTLQQEAGYHHRELTISASEFGVPQRRNRLYILCDREQKPKPLVAPEAEVACAAQALNQNGRYPFSPLTKPGRAVKTLERAERAFSSLGHETPFLMVYYGTDHGGGWQTLDTPLRTITTLDRFALVRPDGNGGHEMRMLQPPELQAAMGFPPEFKLNHGVRRDKIHLLGNAVCPPVMEAIIRSLTGGQTTAQPEAQEPVHDVG